MGFKNEKGFTMKYFLIWSAIYQEDRQKRLHSLTHSKVMQKFGLHIEKMSGTHAKELMTTGFQEWHHEARHNAFHNLRGDMDHLRQIVDQLTQERLALAEQLTIVYQQLDSVTDTLQKELKTKEELAKELREANEQVFKAGFGGTHLDITSILSNSRPNSRPNTPGRRDAYTISSRRPVEREPSVDKVSVAGSTVGSTRSALGSARVKPRSPVGSVGKASLRSPRSTTNSNLEIETSNLSPESTVSSVTGVCNWGSAIPRMRDSGLLHDNTAPRL